MYILLLVSEVHFSPQCLRLYGTPDGSVMLDKFRYLHVKVYTYVHVQCTVWIRDKVINPRRTCAARVTVVGSVCLFVCLLSHISPLECLFVLKTLSRTQRATKVKKFVGFSLKPLRCRDPASPRCTAIHTLCHFKAHARMNEACQLVVRAQVWRQH